MPITYSRFDLGTPVIHTFIRISRKTMNKPLSHPRQSIFRYTFHISWPDKFSRTFNTHQCIIPLGVAFTDCLLRVFLERMHLQTRLDSSEFSLQYKGHYVVSYDMKHNIPKQPTRLELETFLE